MWKKCAHRFGLGRVGAGGGGDTIGGGGSANREPGSYILCYVMLIYVILCGMVATDARGLGFGCYFHVYVCTYVRMYACMQHV